MKYPGHKFGIAIGLVDQETYAPVGGMFFYRAQMSETKRVAKAWDDTNNTGGGVESEQTTNRRMTVKCSDFYDDLQNMIDTPLGLYEGWYYRLALAPLSTLGVIDVTSPGLCFLCSVVRLAEGNWNPNALEGQPTDLNFNTIREYHQPGDTRAASVAVRDAWTFE